jgi:hypothetical protein
LAQSTRRNRVAWFFAAIVRATPMAVRRITEATLAPTKTEILTHLVSGQLRFHDTRRFECKGAANIPSRWGRLLFLATLTLVIVRITFQLAGQAGHAVIPWLAPVCALLPAASAAFFGLFEYEELEALAEQSEQMHETLPRAQARIRRVAVDRPLAPRVLGGEPADVATIMLSDVSGGAQLFRMKAVVV